MQHPSGRRPAPAQHTEQGLMATPAVQDQRQVVLAGQGDLLL